MSAVVAFQDGSEKDVTSQAVWSNQPGTAGRVNEAGEFTAFTGQVGVETVRAEFQGQVATAAIVVSKRAVIFSIIPAFTNLQSGESIKMKGVGQFEDNTVEFVTENITWSISPGVAAQIDESGLLRSSAGMTGEEEVTAQFQSQIDIATLTIQAQLQPRFEMVEIPGGSFMMGDRSGASSQKPMHEVFTDAFLIGKYEIKNAQYAQFLTLAMARGDIIFDANLVIGRRGRFASLIYTLLQGSPEYPEVCIVFNDLDGGKFRAKEGFEDHPVARVTWYGAAAFCDFYGLRLPTEAEWEKASRGGQQLEYGTRDGTISHDLANYSGVEGVDIFDGLAPVGSFFANPFGLHDICGNAAEYVFDVFEPTYYEFSPGSNPTGPGPETPLGRIEFGIDCNKGGSLMILRGGSWLLPEQSCKSAVRLPICDLPDLIVPTNGFRVARSLP